MKRIYSLAGALTLAALPVTIQEVSASASNTPTQPSQTQDAPAHVFEVDVYMVDTWHQCASVDNPAAESVRGVLELALLRIRPGSTPALTAQSALQGTFANVSDPGELEPKYYTQFNIQTGEFEEVCIEQVTFTVDTPTGLVAVDVTEHM